jgi:glutamate-1-semialdehyde aminotransferase
MEQHTSPQALLQWLLARMPSHGVADVGAPQSVPTDSSLTADNSETGNDSDSATDGEAHTRPNPVSRIERKVSDAFQLDAKQRIYLDQFLADYANRTPSSKAFAQRHRRHLADPRAVSGFHPVWKEIVYPIVTERSSGSRLWDIDGNEYIDFLNGFGCILFGHSPAFLTEAVREQLDKGIEVGPQTALAGEVAELFCQLTGNDRVAFSNTGSEAVAGALRVARTVTGRDKIVMFEGAYHGIFDEVVVRAGPKGLALPGSPGIPRSHTGEVVVLPYGDDASLREIARLGRELAAVLVEPVQSRRPELQPVAFLKQLREITTANETALILDEVVTGFRSHPGGIQALFGVRADLAIYGKVVGGGHPIGLIAGRKEYLDALDGGFWQFGDDSVPEVGVTFFAGTFVRHPVALASARAVLRRLIDAGPSLQHELGRRTSAMVGEIKSFLAQMGARVKIESFQSVMYISTPPSENWSNLLFAKMRHHGIHVGDHFPCFLTTSHSDADLARFKMTFCNVVTELVECGFLTGKVADPNAPNPQQPPVEGARLGRRADGSLAWFVPDPDRPGQFAEVGVD